MRYGQLKSFHHVAMLGGFSKAAENLGLTQPAVSEHVRNLEQAHDIQLFRREKRQVFLTDAGAGLFRMTKPLFEIEAEIEAFLTESRTTLDGELRIIADSAIHLTPYLGPFCRRFPKVRVTLMTGNTDDVVDKLRAYDAEIGVVGSPAPGPDMEVAALGGAPIVAFAASGFEVDFGADASLIELSKLPLVMREVGSKTRQKVEESARRVGVKLAPSIIAEGREAVRELVASGAGVGFVSESEFPKDPGLQKIKLADADLKMSESLIHLRQRRDVRLIRSFLNLVSEIQRANR